MLSEFSDQHFVAYSNRTPLLIMLARTWSLVSKVARTTSLQGAPSRSISRSALHRLTKTQQTYKTNIYYKNTNAITPLRFAQYATKPEAPSPDIKKTFVSSHFKIDPNVIYSFLKRKNIMFKEVPSDDKKLRLRDCQWCHDTKNKYSNQYKLYINKDNGSYLCFRCGSRGSW